MKRLLLTTVSAIALIAPAMAGDIGISGSATKEKLSGAYTGKAYSPYAKRTFPERPLWGDNHLHTSLSFDAGAFGNRLPQRDAYRFARGEEVIATSGQPVRLARPLDWLAITDHSDGMGFTDDVLAALPVITKYEKGARWSKGFRAGGQKAVDATLDMITAFSQGKIDKEMFANYLPGSRRYATLWEDVIQAAEEFNDPGRFTTFIGFE
jgi:hypothetical protein